MSKLDLGFVRFFIGESLLLALAIAACTLVISNTISMTILARRETIEIMRLVGATDGFIRRPFYFEGFIQGIVSGTVTFVLLYGVWRWIHHAVPDIDAYIFMFTIGGERPLSNELLMALIIPLGGLLGVFGSFVAVRRVF
jgi:cell division transport system permease protein